jgi:hypothetical protein
MVKIYETVNFYVVLYGYRSLGEELTVTMFENRVPRKIFGPKRDQIIGDWKNYIIKIFINCTPHQIALECLNVTCFHAGFLVNLFFLP